jgi:uncharacterized phage-like protein YoqJ
METSENLSQTFEKVMVTGHRPQGMTNEQAEFAKRALKSIGRQLKQDFGTVEAISGMALGVDIWWAMIALKLDLELAAYIPFPQQPDPWWAADKERWTELRKAANREVLCADEFSIRALHIRNDAMIKDSDLAIAVWSPSNLRGGTASAVQKIRRRGMPMVLVDLDNLAISRENF